MKTVAAGIGFSHTFLLVDADGVALSATALRARVLDEAETVLAPWTAVTLDEGLQTASVSVVSGLNILTPPALRGLRTIELEVTTADRSVLLSESILIQSTTLIAVGINSLQTYNQAVLVSVDFADDTLPGWAAAPRAEREKALIEAWERICRLPIGVQFDDTQSLLMVDQEFTYTYGPFMLRQMATAQLSNLHPVMKAGICKCQVLEADEILQGDPQRALRTSNLVQRKVGESLDVYRGNTGTASKPLQFPISDRAMEQVVRWVRYGARIGRR